MSPTRGVGAFSGGARGDAAVLDLDGGLGWDLVGKLTSAGGYDGVSASFEGRGFGVVWGSHFT